MADVRKKELKICGVCGDHALGSNFNAVTCESCKAFFRRNALKTKDFKCPFSNNCNVDVVTRRFCQKCRLKKCFEIGMKKEWIMTDEEKKAKRRKIEKNRLKKSSQQHSELIEPATDFTIVKVESPDSMNNVLLSPASSMSPMTPQTPGSERNIPEPQIARLLNHQPLTPSDYEYSPPSKVVILDSGDDVINIARSCSSSPLHHKEKNLQDIDDENNSNPASSSSLKQKTDVTGCKRSLSECNSNFNVDLPSPVYMKAVAIEFTELPIRELNNNSKNLSALEKAKVEELVVANAVLKLPLACGKTDPSLIDVINMTDHAIRRLIKMSKKIKSFKHLCQNDQVSLLKGGCTELMILRSVMSYDPEKECWRGPQGPKRMSIKVDILKEAKGNVYEEHKRFINSFEPQWRTDENIMLILSAIALFTPERPNILHRDVIKMEQDTYYYLLRRYLESIYSMCEAKSSYLKLIHKIQELHILNENHVRVYLDVNPKEVEPLLIEIFDLK